MAKPIGTKDSFTWFLFNWSIFEFKNKTKSQASRRHIWTSKPSKSNDCVKGGFNAKNKNYVNSVYNSSLYNKSPSLPPNKFSSYYDKNNNVSNTHKGNVVSNKRGQRQDPNQRYADSQRNMQNKMHLKRFQTPKSNFQDNNLGDGRNLNGANMKEKWEK
jgi:hypothetical protein